MLDEVPHCDASSTFHSHHFWAKYSFLETVLKNTLSMHSSLNVRDHVSQPYSTTVILLFLIFLFLNSEREVKKTEEFGLNNDMNLLL